MINFIIFAVTIIVIVTVIAIMATITITIIVRSHFGSSHVGL